MVILNKFITIFLFIFTLSTCTRANEVKYFICDILPEDLKKEVDPNRPFDGVRNYFDRSFFYKKKPTGEYSGFSYGGSSLGIQLKGDILSTAYLKTAREQQGYYREIFDVYRFHIKKRMLIHSYVYYISLKDYNKNFNNPSFVPYNKPFLFDLIPRKAPEDYVKIGWDKTRWQCYEVSYLKYFIFNLKGLLYLFTA